MEKKSVKIRTCLLVSVINGALAFVIVFSLSWNNPSGNTPREIEEIEKEIKKISSNLNTTAPEQQQSTFDFEAFKAAANGAAAQDKLAAEQQQQKAQTDSRAKQGIEAFRAAVSAAQAEEAQQKAQQAEAERRIQLFDAAVSATQAEEAQQQQHKPFDFSAFDAVVNWAKIKDVTIGLTTTNQKIAKAKVLMTFNYNPIQDDSFETYLWEERYIISNQKWSVQTTGEKVWKGIKIGSLSFVGAFISMMLFLAIIPLLWFFLMERISELSQAIQGK